jgi:hypothetical protein
MPEPMWARRRTGLPLDESFQFGSFRSAPDQSGDFLLIDGCNGASRNPHHSFAILELRLGGCTLLKGYRNQLLTRLDGMVEPRVAMDARLRDRRVEAQQIRAQATLTAPPGQVVCCRIGGPRFARPFPPGTPGVPTDRRRVEHPGNRSTTGDVPFSGSKRTTRHRWIAEAG